MSAHPLLPPLRALRALRSSRTSARLSAPSYSTQTPTPTTPSFTDPAPQKPLSKSVSPPSRILIYNQGIRRSAFAGFIRAVCAGYMGWSAAALGSALRLSQFSLTDLTSLTNLSSLTDVLSLSSSLAPLAPLAPVVAAGLYSSLVGAFVCTIHLELPSHIRADPRRYASLVAGLVTPETTPTTTTTSSSSSSSSSLPPSLGSAKPMSAPAIDATIGASTLHIRTPHVLGFARLSAIPISRLRLTNSRERWQKPWLAMANLRADIDTDSATPRPNRLFLSLKPRAEFIVTTGTDRTVQRNSLAPGVWERVWTHLERKSAASR